MKYFFVILSLRVLFDDVLIVELKSMKRIIRDHKMQLINYLTSTGKPVIQ